MTASLDRLLFREALRTGPVMPNVQDLIAWAPLFGEDGTILRDCAALIAGVAQDIPPTHDWVGADWTLEIAIDELENTACRFTPLLVAPERPRPSGRPDCAHGIGSGIPAGRLPSDIGETVRALTTLLAEPAEPDMAALTTHLEALAEIARRLPALDYRLLADAPADLLIAAIAATVLADFVLRTRDLAGEPLGSPALLHRSARFSAVGLGPWFSNVGRISRNSYDVFDLARIACAAAGHHGDEAVGAWIALLSRGCEGTLLRHLIDDLADYGAMAPLTLILDRALSRPAAAIDMDNVMYLRDAALDNGDHHLAARAQARIVRLRPTLLLEHEILGSILASGGDFREADATFRAALEIDPHHEGIRARLAALGTPGFTQFLIHQGFSSPADRVHTRLHRRGKTFNHTRHWGGRIPAVDVR